MSDGDIYTYVGVPDSRYELLGACISAGTYRGLTTLVYRDLKTGQLYNRLPADFVDRMVKVESEQCADS